MNCELRSHAIKQSSSTCSPQHTNLNMSDLDEINPQYNLNMSVLDEIQDPVKMIEKVIGKQLLPSEE